MSKFYVELVDLPTEEVNADGMQIVDGCLFFVNGTDSLVVGYNASTWTTVAKENVDGTAT